MKYFFITLLGTLLFSSCVILHKKSPDKYMARAKKYSDKKDYARACEFYSKAIKLNPILYRAYWGRAIAEINMGFPEKAIDDITKYIDSDIDPTSLARAYYQRGQVMLKLGYKVDACGDFNSACELNIDNAPCEEYRKNCK